VLSESRALVIGAGSVGLLTALLLQDKGVENIVIAETNPLRRELVKQHCDF
jgi:alcohol dehydrogenase